MFFGLSFLSFLVEISLSFYSVPLIKSSILENWFCNFFDRLCKIMVRFLILLQSEIMSVWVVTKFFKNLLTDPLSFDSTSQWRTRELSLLLLARKQPKKITFADEAGGLLCHVKVFQQLPASRWEMITNLAPDRSWLPACSFLNIDQCSASVNTCQRQHKLFYAHKERDLQLIFLGLRVNLSSLTMVRTCTNSNSS